MVNSPDNGLKVGPEVGRNVGPMSNFGGPISRGAFDGSNKNSTVHPDLPKQY